MYGRQANQVISFAVEFRTIVELPPSCIILGVRSRAVLVGSCFAGHIGQRLADAMPEGRCAVNPSGVVYNPESVASAVEMMMDGTEPLNDKYFTAADGSWRNWLCSGEYSAETEAGCRRKIEENFNHHAAVLAKADVLFLTFSTDHGYYHHEGGLVVANCHKMPQRLFDERAIPYEQMLRKWDDLLGRIECRWPGMKVVFTVSPYRYRKYGLTESQSSKAKLRVLIDSLIERHSSAAYFPAYEILVDELRDYRFYAPDMLHPSEQAVDYVWERFKEWAFSEELADFARDKSLIVRDANHRLLHPDSVEARQFEQKRRERLVAFQRKWGEAAGLPLADV